jgi:hypothetical protein
MSARLRGSRRLEEWRYSLCKPLQAARPLRSRRLLLRCAATAAQACARGTAPRPLRGHRSRLGRAWRTCERRRGVSACDALACAWPPERVRLPSRRQRPGTHSSAARCACPRPRRGGQAARVNVHSAVASSRASGRATLPRLTRMPCDPGAARVRACVLAARRAHDSRGAPHRRATQPARAHVRYRPHASRRSARCVLLTQQPVPPRASQPRVLCAPHGRRRRSPARERCAAWQPRARVAPTWRQRAEEGAAGAARARRSRPRLLRAPHRAGAHAPRHAAAREAAAVLRRLQTCVR